MINKKYIYPKEYFLKGNKELILKNQQYINEYIDDKIKLLINSDNKNNVISEIIFEVKELVEFDINNSQIIGMPVDENLQKELIQKYDIVYILGNIFVEYHLDLIKNNKNNIPNIQYLKYVIDYNELYDEALTDYFKKLLNISFDDVFEFKKSRSNNKKLDDLDNMIELMIGNKENTILNLIEYRGILLPVPNPIPKEIMPKIRKKSYLASFVFPALIERIIIDFLRDYYFDLGIKLLSEKNQEIYNNDDNERKVMMQVRSGNTFVCFNQEMFSTIIINMLKKYKVFSKGELEIFGSGATIGKIFHMSTKDNKPSFFAKHFKKEYYYLLERMFKFLNTRNNTMHLNNTNENYFSLEFSSILLQLFWLSTSGEIFELD